MIAPPKQTRITNGTTTMMKAKKNRMSLTSSGKIFLNPYQRTDTVAIERNNANTSTSTISSIRRRGGAIRGIIAFLSPTSHAFCHVARDTSRLICSEQLGLSSSMDQGGGKRR